MASAISEASFAKPDNSSAVNPSASIAISTRFAGISMLNERMGAGGEEDHFQRIWPGQQAEQENASVANR